MEDVAAVEQSNTRMTRSKERREDGISVVIFSGGGVMNG